MTHACKKEKAVCAGDDTVVPSWILSTDAYLVCCASQCCWCFAQMTHACKKEKAVRGGRYSCPLLDSANRRVSCVVCLAVLLVLRANDACLSKIREDVCVVVGLYSQSLFAIHQRERVSCVLCLAVLLVLLGSLSSWLFPCLGSALGSSLSGFCVSPFRFTFRHWVLLFPVLP
jgi:hypothetical protein